MGTHPIFESDFDCLTEFNKMSETAANEVELEETCWCTITILVSIIIAAFSYRFFGPENPETSTKKASEPAREVYVQEIKREEPKQTETEPLIEKTPEVESSPLNESSESAETHHSRESSSGPEFEIIDASDVPSTNEIELSQETPKEESIPTPTEETRDEGPAESAITDVDIELVSNLPPSKSSDDEPKLPDEDVEETEVQEVDHSDLNSTEDLLAETQHEPQEDEIVPIDVNNGNLERYEDEIMQGNFADQTLFTPAKPAAVQSLPTKTNDTLQDLELDHSDLNLTDDLNQTDDLLASPERDEIDSVEKVESKTEEEVDLETPSKEEDSFENIPATERSESPDPIIAQQEIIPDSVPEVQEVIPSESPKPSEPVQPEPKVQDRNDSPVESTPEPDEEIIEENVITDTDSVKNEITESDIRKVAEDLIDKTLDNVEQKLKTDSMTDSNAEIGSGDASSEAEIRAKQLAEIDALMKEKGMGELDPEQTKMYLE